MNDIHTRKYILHQPDHEDARPSDAIRVQLPARFDKSFDMYQPFDTIHGGMKRKLKDGMRRKDGVLAPQELKKDVIEIHALGVSSTNGVSVKAVTTDEERGKLKVRIGAAWQLYQGNTHRSDMMVRTSDVKRVVYSETDSLVVKLESRTVNTVYVFAADQGSKLLRAIQHLPQQMPVDNLVNPSQVQRLVHSVFTDREQEILEHEMTIPRETIPLKPLSSLSLESNHERNERHKRKRLIKAETAQNDLDEDPIELFDGPASISPAISPDSSYTLRSRQDKSINVDPPVVEKTPIRQLTLHPDFSFPPSGLGNIAVGNEDLQKLQHDEFLNDVIIDFYLKFVHRELHQLHPHRAKHTYIFNSLFYRRLLQEKGNYEQVSKWIRRVDLFDMEHLVLPINENMHWSVAIICNLNTLKPEKLERRVEDLTLDNRARGNNIRIHILDSLGLQHAQTFKSIRSFLIHQAATRLQREVPRDALKGHMLPVPTQDNSCDCGLYVLHFVQEFLMDPAKFLERLPSKSDRRGLEVAWQTDVVPYRREGIRDLLEYLNTLYYT